MKAILALLAAIPLIFGMAGPASASILMDEKGSHEFLSMADSSIYAHTENAFEVQFVDAGQSPIRICSCIRGENMHRRDAQGVYWGLLNDVRYTYDWDRGLMHWIAVPIDVRGKELDIGSVFAPWDQGNQMEFQSDFYERCFGFCGLCLDYSTLNFDYQNYENNAALVPEPATMLLLGCGLIGMGAIGRKSFFKNR